MSDLPDTTPLGPGPADGSATNAYPTSLFRSYLLTLLPAVIGASVEDIESTLLSEEKADEWDDKATRFCSDGAMGVVYVNQVREPGAEGEGQSIGPPWVELVSAD